MSEYPFTRETIADDMAAMMDAGRDSQTFHDGKGGLITRRAFRELYGCEPEDYKSE